VEVGGTESGKSARGYSLSCQPPPPPVPPRKSRRERGGDTVTRRANAIKSIISPRLDLLKYSNPFVEDISSMADITSMAACLAEQLRLLGYVVLPPPATAPEPAEQATHGVTTPESPTPESAAPVRLHEEAPEAETPPAKYDFTAYFLPAPAKQLLLPLIKEENPGGHARPTGYETEDYFLDTGIFDAAVERANECTHRGTKQNQSTPDAGPGQQKQSGSSQQVPDAGLLMAEAIVRGRTYRGAGHSPDRLRHYADGGPPGPQQPEPKGHPPEPRSSDRRRHSVVGGPPGTEASLSLCSTSTVSSVATMLIPSRRDTVEDGAAQPAAPFWEPAQPASGNHGSEQTTGGGFGSSAGFSSGFGSTTGFNSAGFGRFSPEAGEFGSTNYPPKPTYRGKGGKGGGKGGFARKGGGKETRRPGVDVRCPACGFWRN